VAVGLERVRVGTLANNLVVVGFYYFKRSELLIDCIREQIERDIRTQNEYFLADAVNLDDFGVTGLILPERRSAEVTAAVCKASAGAVEHLPVAKIRNLADFLADAKRAGLWCYGADQVGATTYAAMDFSGPVVLVLGSEGRGLRPRVAGACDAIVSIPLRGRVQSLSVSAAAAVLIFAAAADRSSPAPRA